MATLRKVIGNIKNIRTTVIGVATLLIAAGTALAAFADSDKSTVPDWQAVITAASSVAASLWLIIGSKD
jgi:predicted ribosomally synthesized peptide with SipW-like signal peptide